MSISFALHGGDIDEKPEVVDANYAARTQVHVAKVMEKAPCLERVMSKLLIEVNKRIAQSGRVGQGSETVESAGLGGGKRFEA